MNKIENRLAFGNSRGCVYIEQHDDGSKYVYLTNSQMKVRMQDIFDQINDGKDICLISYVDRSQAYTFFQANSPSSYLSGEDGGPM